MKSAHKVTLLLLNKIQVQNLIRIVESSSEDGMR